MTKTDGVIVSATAAAGVAAETFVPVMGVIFMGALGGAIFALLRSPNGFYTLTRAQLLVKSASIMVPRWLLSIFLSWAVAALVQSFLAEHNYIIQRTALLLAVSFTVAAYREILAELKPLVRLWIFPRGLE